MPPPCPPLLCKRQAHVAELLGQIAGLEEDNRVLAEAARWEKCSQSEVLDGIYGFRPIVHVALLLFVFDSRFGCNFGGGENLGLFLFGQGRCAVKQGLATVQFFCLFV